MRLSFNCPRDDVAAALEDDPELSWLQSQLKSDDVEPVAVAPAPAEA
jgi:hypothetical protein